MSLHIPSSAGYNTHATALAEQYESIDFAALHSDVLHWFPAAPARIVDIGAGSGRDAAALARLGHQVTAVEPTAELREQGQRIHAQVPILWINDHLPALAALQQRQERYDLMLLTAVWMHLDAGERQSAMGAIATLLAPGGRVIMSLRRGPVPAGRRMFDVSAAETAALGADHGLVEIYRGTRSDVQGRADVHWSVLVLQQETVKTF